MKKILIFNFLFFAFPAFAADGLVTCGLGDGQYCTPCDLWTLASNIVNFLVKPLSGIAFPILVLALLIGGVVWTTSMGDPARIEKGKKIITSSIIGVFIAFGGWLIVDTIIKTLAEGKITAAWNTIKTCEKPITAPTTQPTTGASIGIMPPTGVSTIVDNQNLANNLAISGGVIFSGKGDCNDVNGNKVSAAINLGELQRGEGLTVCQNRCSTTMILTCTKTNKTLNTKLLSDLAIARNTGVNFRIESLTTGDHSPNSDHYQGNAADIIPAIPNQNNYTILRDTLRAQNPQNASKIFCKDKNGKAVASCGTGTTHLHATVK